jgi:hypothetical protein
MTLMTTESPAKVKKIAMKVVIEMTPEQIQGLACEYGLGDGVNVPDAELRDFAKSYIREHAQGGRAADFWTATVS